MAPLMEQPWTPHGVLRRRGGAAVRAAWALVLVKAVQVKMLPFDNKSEFQVVLDLPEGTTLETSNRAASEIAAYLSTVPEVVSTQVYAGTAAPFNFNGLVRHYFMRSGANVADVQVNLLPKGERDAAESRHRGGRAARRRLDRAALRGVGQGGGDSAGPAGALDAGGRGVRGRRLDAAGGGHAR